MKTIAATLGAAVAAFALLAATEGSRSVATTGPGTIKVTTRQVSYQRVDVGTRGRSPGDGEVITQLVYNRNITPKSIGHVESICNFTVGISRNCRATVFLPKGKLVLGGTIRYQQLFELAVLGGTGLYDNARGSVTVTRISRKPTRNLYVFRLVG